MANEEQLARLCASIAEKNRCTSWNKWRQNDWDGATRSYLTSIDLRGADLVSTDLTDIVLDGADLAGADLAKANLMGANLTSVNFYFANLSFSNLHSANLSRASFFSTNINYANFTNTVVRSARFDSLDFRYVMGLASVRHLGPSTIGIDTVYQSHGEIPDVFLRGCGLPDEMIGFAHSIAGAIQYYSAFISYNHEDETFATRLYNDLQANNVRCWKYTEDVKIGDVIERTVDQAIRLHDKLLVIFSAQSVASDWVADEVERAMKREEQEQKPILFPVTIDDAINQVDYGWARKVCRHRNIGDFTGWEHQQRYQPLFDRLLHDLKSNER